MTDNEIIKALECCNQEDMCDQCPYDFACYDEKYKSILSKDALDLINRQQAEIEELQKRIVFWREDMDYHPERVRAEAMEEFAERLKEKSEYYSDLLFKTVDVEEIDNLVKELTHEPTKIKHNSLCETETYESR